ncbi:MAG: SDR family NAD(P)-dependent oxidoreductase [Roseiarcus sp.]
MDAEAQDLRFSMVATVAERLGAVYIRVNNAALGMNSVADDYDDEHLQIEDVPDDLWRRFFAVNVGGAFSMTRAAVPIFRKQKWGRVVNASTSILTLMRKGFVPDHDLERFRAFLDHAVEP